MKLGNLKQKITIEWPLDTEYREALSHALKKLNISYEDDTLELSDEQIKSIIENISEEMKDDFQFKKFNRYANKLLRDTSNLSPKQIIQEEYITILDILNINPDKTDILGGLIYLDEVTYQELREVKEEVPRFYEKGTGLNGAPDNEEFLDFLKINPQFVGEAYLVTPERRDYRFEIVGIKADYNDKNISILDDFLRYLSHGFEEPSEYGEYKNKIRAWWD